MDTEIEYRRILFEYMLNAIAVMDVPVDNQDSLQAQDLTGEGGTQGNVVEQAESHGPAFFGMMTRRTGQNESIVDAPFNNAGNRFKEASGGHPGRMIRIG
jgi:hypothetical protein